jgi:uncharacterized protein
MKIQQQNDDKRGAFFIEENGAQLAEMTYVWSGEKMFIIDHTLVDESLKGQGVGKRLVEAAVDFARKKEIKILPLCPFAKAVFERMPEFQDVLR